MDDMDLQEYLLYQLVRSTEIRKVFEDPDGNMLRTISSGGAFTNKINRNGFFEPIDEREAEKLIDYTLRFYRVVNSIANDYFTPEKSLISTRTFRIFRTVNMNHVPMGDILQPIPMSCTWSYEFARGWLHGNCCIYVIDVPYGNDYLTLSNPMDSPYAQDGPHESQFGTFYTLNQGQSEITLGPCYLIFNGNDVIDGINHIYFTVERFQGEMDVYRAIDYVIEHGIFL